MKGSSSVFLLGLSSLSNIIVYGQNTPPNCYDAYSCDEDLESSPTQTTLNCFGFFSCANVDASLVITNADCDGSYSCYDIDSITISTSLECDGLYSCSSTDITLSTFDTLNCYGERSCYDNTITLSGSTSTTCNGQESCANSIIYADDEDDIDVYGTLGLYNSFIRVNDAFADVTINLWGTSSGRGLVINGTSNADIVINCYGVDSCTDLELNCDGGGTSCYTVNCEDYSTQTDYCAGEISDYNNIIDRDTTLPDLDSILDMSNFVEAGLGCNDINSTTTCLDYQECNDLTISSSEIICCSGSESCDNVNTLETIAANVPIRCDGGLSCNDMSSVTATGGANLFFTGYNALGSTNYATIRTTTSYNILCTGYYSCSYSYFYDAANLYCTSYQSCYDPVIISNIGNLHLYGYSAAYASTVRSISGNIYAGGLYSLQSSNVYNVDGTIYATGAYSLQSSTIYNVTNIVAQGYWALDGAYIYGFERIDATGYQPLEDVFLYSNNFASTTTLNINTTGTNDIFFRCTEGDTCYINCLSNNACGAMDVYCEDATCFIECSVFEGDISCPSLQSGSFFTNFTTGDSTGDNQLIEVTGDTNCHNATSCTNLRIIADNTLECYGYSSCYNSRYIGFINSFTVNCDGSYSCYNTTSMVGLGTVNCDGLSSCSKISKNLQTGTTSNLNCYGELSCAYSTLNVHDINCYGDRSCMNSIINFESPDSDSYTFYGVKAAAGATLTVDSSNYAEYQSGSVTTTKDTINFYFYGAMSGYKTTIVCGFWKNCIANCYGSNACVDLTMRCGDEDIALSKNGDDDQPLDNGCNIFVKCDDSDTTNEDDDLGNFEEEDFCDYRSTDTINVIEDSLRYASDFDDTGVPDCVEDPTVRLVCNDYQGCLNEDPLFFDEGDICCGASYGCQNNNFIALNSSSENGVQLRCDGGYSCTGTGAIILGNNITTPGSAYITGYYGASSTTFYGSGFDDSNLLCSGAESCSSSQFYNLDYIICSGQDGCRGNTFYNILSTIYLTGYASGYGGTFVNVEGYIYCFGYLSCYDSEFYNIGQTIYGLGQQVAYSAKIHSAREVYIKGYQGLQYSVISNVAEIYAEGYQVLEYSLIMSNGTDMEIDIDMNGMNGPTWIICNQTDECKIVCVSANACRYVSFACYSNDCQVRCNNDEIICPYAEDGTTYNMKTKLTSAQKAALKDVTTSIPSALTSSSKSNSDDFDWTAFMIVFVLCILAGVIAFLVYRYYTQNKGGVSGDKKVEMIGQTSAGPGSPQ